VLWDIDNTLLYTGGAGSLAMRRAFHELYGVEDAFRRVEFSGRTDAAIFRDAARLHGIDQSILEEEQLRFLEAYLIHLPPALAATNGALMPGVARLLEALASHDGVMQALGTGNFRRSGELKLRYYGIAGYFPGMPGGFGEDSESRDVMIGHAIARVCNGSRPRVVVIGDTPHDMTAARANGAVALGVATGRNSVEELFASGADAAVEDLSDLEQALSHIVA
jgi:phosphoglycolate phosphatase-like HAD superfamily hydrolase